MKNYTKEWDRYCSINNKYNISRGLNEHDLNCLLHYASEFLSNSVYVEIGVSEGSSISAMAGFRPDINCYGVEIEGIEKSSNVIKQEGLDNVTLIHGGSADICKTWDKEIDMMFIDGDHNSPQVFLDVIGWFPYIRSNGVILFHDYETGKFGRQYDVCDLSKVFKNHNRFKTYIPSEDDCISSSMMIVTKL